MSRKRPRQDSLELFLDAICNMFGGFLFLMLFVVVSIRATHEATSKPNDVLISETELAELDLESTNLRNERNALIKQIKQSKETFDRLYDPEVAEIYSQAIKTQNRARELEKANETLIKERGEQQKKRDDVQAQTLEARQKADDLRKEEKEILLAAEQESLQKARTVSPPQMKRSSKQEVAVVLKYGRLYFWHKKDDAERRLNDEEFVVVEETEDVLITEPKLWKGIDLKSPDVEKQLAQAFATYDPAVVQIGIVVADDSYEEYGTLRSFLKGRLFEIRPIIGKVGAGVFDRGGTNVLTQ